MPAQAANKTRHSYWYWFKEIGVIYMKATPFTLTKM